MKQAIVATSLLLLLLTSLLSACSRRHTEPITGSLPDYRNPHVQSGHVLYDRYCYRCHPSGEAGLGPEVIGKPGFARRMQTRHGLGVMPAFSKHEISKDELNDIMAYLRDLKHQK